MHPRSLVIVRSASCFALLVLTASAARAEEKAEHKSIFKRSHIAAWMDEPDSYKMCDVDVLVQDMSMVSDADAQRWGRFIDKMHKQGKLVCAEMRPATHMNELLEYVMNDESLQAAACVDLHGKPIEVPWMVGHIYKGRTPVFLCSNQPHYREFLRDQVRYFMAAGVDGIMVDDGGGSYFAFGRGCCFCPCCMEGFREYLGEKYTAEQLKRRGVDDLDSFDYRQFVSRQEGGGRSYRNWRERANIPFSRDFNDFLLHSDVELFRELQKLSCELAGKHIPMGWDNVDFGGARAGYYPFWDVFYSEINYQNFGVDGRIPDTEFSPGIVMLDKFADAATFSGELKTWHKITLAFTGPKSSEMATNPNPFLDFRLNVTFTKGTKKYTVPGYFAADGNAAHTHATKGDQWRVHFTPDEEGTWTYSVSFRSGAEIAISKDKGVSAGYFDGETGTFQVTPSDKHGDAFRSKGMLTYAGGFYLRFSGTGEYWIKGGTDSPEDLLAYDGFDNTVGKHRFGLHRYAAHHADWQSGDPDWGDGRGRNIIGMLNYLGAQHVNSIYFLPMNIGGDGKNTHPFASTDIDHRGNPANDNLHYDISKLCQWETVFEHAQAKGIALHFVFNERERPNKEALDNGALGVERKLFYRELIARFGHHNALIWNLCEEYQGGNGWGNLFSADRIKQFAQYIREVDAYDHPLTVHNAWLDASDPFYGDNRFDATSVQADVHWFRQNGKQEWQVNMPWYGELTERLRKYATDAGRPLPIMWDEVCRVKTSDDETHSTDWPSLSGQSWLRRHMLYNIYFSGGQIEHIVEDLLDTSDFRRYEKMWKYTWNARKFMEEHLPFWEMEPADALLTGESGGYEEDGQVFAETGEVYAIHLPRASQTGCLDLPGGSYILQWYNPRTGKFEGTPKRLTGGTSIALGAAPSDSEEDWVALIRKTTVPGSATYIYPKPGKPWPVATPESQGMSTAILEKSRALMRSSAGEPLKPVYGIVIRNGYDVWHYDDPYRTDDWTWEGHNQRWASCVRSMQTAMFGMAVKEGLIHGGREAVERPVNSINCPEAKRYNDGILLKHPLSYTSCSDPPGSGWRYGCNSSSMNQIIAELDGGHPETGRLMNLGKIIGAGYWRLKRKGGPWKQGESFYGRRGNENMCELYTAEADAARWGYLWLRKGNWDGRQLVDPWFVERSQQPMPSPLGGYAHGNEGWQIHLNANGMWGDSVPDDAYAALGSFGSTIFVCPSLDLVTALHIRPSPYEKLLIDSEVHRDIRASVEPIIKAVKYRGGTQTPTGEMVFPGEEWQERTPESQGIDSSQLHATLKYLESQCGKDGIHEVVIIRNGYMIYQGDRVEKRRSVASVGKVFTSTVLGLLIDEGKCTLDTLACDYDPLLKEHYPAVRLRHFATMTSGYDAKGHHQRHLNAVGDGKGDWGPNACAVAQPLFAPGEKYLYYDEAMFMFGRVLTAIAQEPMKDYLTRRVGDPIGMGEWAWNSGRLVEPINGIPVNWGCGMVRVNAKQLARLGHLYLNHGKWNGRQLISRQWVAQATRNQVPTSIGLIMDSRQVEGRGIYGYHWWIKGTSPTKEENLPDAPEGTFYRSGAGHNMLFVVPKWNMVIVRLGNDGSSLKQMGTWNAVFRRIGASFIQD